MVEINKETITPAKAKAMLERNFEGQRNIRKNVVDKYASDMRSGAWNESVGGLIVVSDTNKVIDGQHRLRAVIESDTPIEFYVQTGVEESAYKVIDSGISRTVQDVIDCKHKAAVAAIARMMAAFKKGMPVKSSMKGSAPVSKAENIKYVEENTERLVEAARYNSAIHNIIGRAAAQGVGAALYLMMLDNPDVVEYFMECFKEMLPSDERVASFKTQAQNAIINEKWDKYKQFAMTMRVLEAIRDDEPRFKRFVNTDSVIDRWNERIKRGIVNI